MNKIALFYLVGQPEFLDWKSDFYTPQIEVLKESGLYENIDFIDIHVWGDKKEQLPFIPDKIRNVRYLPRTKNEESDTMKLIWEFSQKVPNYKILYFNALGISIEGYPEITERKHAWRNYLEYCNIHLWKECTELLNFYDAVGTELLMNAVLKNYTIIFKAPHFQGNFWWVNSSYIKTLDPLYLDQEVEYKRYLAEFFVGSGKGNLYCTNKLGINPYDQIAKFDRIKIKEKVNYDLSRLKVDI